ncbi:39S ribosomal protein L16, partial [Nibea albiflora]
PEDVVLPEKPKLKFMNKVPNLKKAKKEIKNLRDIRGPAQTANSFTTGQYAIVVMSRESLADMQKEQAEMEQNNQNPWTFKQIARGNMLGIRKALSPFDVVNNGRFTGKFHNPGRV